MKLGFYRAFEDKYRGSRELIKSRPPKSIPIIVRLMYTVARPSTKALGRRF